MVLLMANFGNAEILQFPRITYLTAIRSVNWHRGIHHFCFILSVINIITLFPPGPSV